jgi:hypothetical protein
MQGENPAKRSRFAFMTIVVLVGAVVTMLLATPASAFHSKNPSRNNQWDTSAPSPGDVYQGFDPMETSIPYVAWRGEELRLVKCFDPKYFEPRENGDPREGGLTDEELSILALEANETGEWQIMDWSGDAHVWPKFFDDNDQQTQVFWPRSGEQEGRGCFAIDITSHKPGIAIVKLKVDDEGDRYADGVGEGVKGEGDPVATHQFVVIWMAFQDARLRDLDAANPLGPVTINPGDRNNLGVVVQGRIPLNEEFSTELGLDDTLVFPEDYPALARSNLGHISWALQKANNGIEGDDNYNNPTCDDNPATGAPTGVAANNDDGSLDDPDPAACDTDRGDEEEGLDLAYVPEPRHSPGDFWDIHDSTGPYNTSVYGPNKPLIEDICPGPETETHNADCHVDQFADYLGQEPDTYVGGGGDDDCDNGDPNGAGGTAEGNDTVDNCDDGEWDAFSRVFHDVAGEKDGQDLVIGPYSPTRPDETLLSDSDLNAHDAPMPAALVVVSIAPNQGNGDIGGVGSLVADVDKHEVYNRGGENCDDDGTPVGDSPDNKHCVTGPFSGAYIPPSPTMENNPAQDVPDLDGTVYEPEDDDSDTASGIHGAIANNFNGYLPVYYPEHGDNRGLYHYWDLVDTLRVAIPTETKCVDPPRGGPRLTPEGPQEIALYTDEHGEARLHFDAGTGFFFDNFIVDETQGGCLPVGLIGTADITVNARYPFQPTTSAGAVSNTLRKNVESLFRKGIICVPKPREEDDKVLCVAFGRDIDGTPLIGERVCVTALGDAFIRDFDEDQDSTREGDSTVCASLDENESEKEDLGTDLFPTIDDSFATETFLIIGRGSVRVIADFRDERLEFGTTVTIPAAAGTTGASVGELLPVNQQLTPVLPPRPVAAPGGTGLIPTVGSSNNATVNTPVNQQVLKPAILKARASLAFVRIVKPLKLGGVRYVVLRVKSPSKTASIQIKLIGKRGKVLGTMLRKVKTNRTIRVPNLRLPKAAVTVRAKVIA